MIVAWRGRKRHPPAQGSAEPGIGTEADVAQVVHRVRFNKLREWDEVLPLWTASGQSVLAVGTSTVETSLRLAQSGRKVVLLSYGEPTLHFARACANELGIEIGLVPWVRESPFPFADGAFGCVYQSGLLEYLAQNERFAVVKEAARVASERVIALVPNASCVAYRAGKARQEEQGTWAHGLGMPLTSLKEEFEGAGLRVVDEYSVGARHALNFLNPNDPLRRALASWMAAAPPGVVEGSNQGYLVITVGEKRPG